MAAPASAPRTPVEQQKIDRFKELTEQVLPALAREGHWPIHFDHCFKRICLDHAFGDVWYNHLRKPAEQHIGGEALARATRCAEELASGDLNLLHDRDNASLRFRGKREKQPPR